MPKSRIAKKTKEATRCAERLQAAVDERDYVKALLEMTEDALEGMGLYAEYNPEPTPHVEILKSREA